MQNDIIISEINEAIKRAEEKKHIDYALSYGMLKKAMENLIIKIEEKKL